MRSPRRLWLESGPILATLVLSLAVTGWLTYAAWRSARMHQRVAEDLLRGHALLAGQRYGARVSDELYVAATSLLRPTPAGRLRGERSAVADPGTILTAAVEARGCECVPAPEPAYAFRLDLGRRRRLTVRGKPLDDSARAALERAIVQAVDLLRPTGGWDFALLPGYAGDEAHSTLIALRAVGADTAVYGFAADSGEIRRWILKPPFRTTALLAPEVAGRLPNDSLLTIGVRRGTGETLFRSSATWPTPYRATSTLPVIWASLGIEVGLQPRVVPLLIPGGVPRPPVALLLALFGASAGLLVLAVGLSWRTHRLALLRSDFTSSVTHELRTPLTQILLYGETLAMRRDRSPAQREAAVGVIVREARRLITMVENILHFSRAERRLTRLDPRVQPIRPIVEEVIAGFEPLAAVREVTMRVEPGGDSAVGRVDADAVRQILLNLLDNAVRYGPEGQTVRVSIAAHVGAVRLMVEDEGSGIPSADRERVWQPFVRLAHAEGEVQTGSGIGLAVVKELTELHGGQCGIESAARGGARVFVDLPAA